MTIQEQKYHAAIHGGKPEKIACKEYNALNETQKEALYNAYLYDLSMQESFWSFLSFVRSELKEGNDLTSY